MLFGQILKADELLIDWDGDLMYVFPQTVGEMLNIMSVFRVLRVRYL